MAIKTAHAGDKPTSGRFAEVASAMKVQEPRSAPAGTLSPRQAQVLNLISYGLSNEEISRTIGIEILTAKEHVSNVLKRLNVPSRLQAAVWAINPQVISEQRSHRAKATPEMTP